MNKNFNITNALSLFRLIAAPIIMFLIIFDRKYSTLILFILAVFTDFLDGYLSRKLKMETKLGDILDKISDKLLVGFIILGFLIRFDALILLFAFIPIILLYIIVYHYFVKYKQKATFFGRINIFLQSIVIIAFILDFKYKFYLFWIIFATTSYVGFSYIYKILRLYKK
ncbi:CDP-alcohol phosphatidyltransferase family protein [Candidatus Woesearchaeota archaeon]|nr:CDP-alcohol phosphatidyltransferase family protein [Candidatus Woesearchaeota archaeon]